MVGAAAGVGIGYLAGYEGTDLIAWGVGGAVIGGVIGAVTGTLISYTATGSFTSSFSQIKAGFAAAKLNPGQCFVAGTLVLTEDGLIPIEEVEDGMLVWASDPETGETALKPVVQLFRNETTELVHVTVNGEEIICTNEHPFYSPVKGWTEACQLRAGDILVLVNGEYVIVEQVQHEILETPVATYNFEVEDFHTYFVGKSSVLVHNKCSSFAFNENQDALIRLAKENKAGVTRENAQTLIDWANEYGINNHGPMIHEGRRGYWSTIEHIKIKNIHIPIIGG